jgi:hypothetical protein
LMKYWEIVMMMTPPRRGDEHEGGVRTPKKMACFSTTRRKM